MKSYSKNFWALCASILLFMTSFNLIVPELNTFITNLRGEEYKGLIMVLFTLSAAISRPFSGKLADNLGRKSTMYVGIIVMTVATFLYPISGTVLFFLLLRFFHGFSTGFLPTGATATITDLLPADKRGQGMGVFGTAISLGIGVGQFLGTPVALTFGINGLFICAGILAIAAGLMITTVKETLENPKPFHISHLSIKKNEWIEKNVLPVGIVMLLSAASSGMLFVITPDLSGYLGIDNKGWFFALYVISTILVRLFTGKLSDKIGRRQTLVIGLCILIVSMILVANAKSIFIYSLASIIFGMATGLNSPTLFAWMADLAPANRRGIGSGTLFIALELGIMLGAGLTLAFYESTFESVSLTFSIAVLLNSLALLFVILHLIFVSYNKAN
ncbi:MAG: MFS transporter [Lishizhenia sp.]